MIGAMPETRGRGTGNEVLTGEGTGREMRKSCSMLEEMNPVTGEPCARKPARTVRRGEVGKGLAEIPPEKVSGRSKHQTAPRWPPTLLTTSTQAKRPYGILPERVHPDISRFE